MKRRRNLNFEDKDWDLFQSLARERNISVSVLLTAAVHKMFRDPLDVVLEEERQINKQLKDIMDRKMKLLTLKNQSKVEEAYE